MPPMPTPTPVPRTLADALAAALADGATRLRSGRSLVRDLGDLEGIHLMRTSARRLRSALKSLGDPLPKRERRQVGADLQRFMTALSPVRDLDVLRRAVGEAPLLRPEESRSLVVAVERKLARAQRRVDGLLDGAAFADLVARIDAAAGALAGPSAERGQDRVDAAGSGGGADDLPAAGAPVALPVPDTASPAATGSEPLALAAPRRILKAIEGTLAARPATWVGVADETLHTLRKSVKRLRYALESFRAAYGRPLARVIERCRELQEELGAIQDAATFERALRGANPFAAGQFLALARVRASTARERLPRLWARAFGGKLLARLGAHLLRRAGSAAAGEGEPELERTFAIAAEGADGSVGSVGVGVAAAAPRSPAEPVGLRATA